MKINKLNWLNRGPEWLAIQTTKWAGSSPAFLLAALLTITWLISGPFFGYSNTWQLAMNTVSSIVTFLMVFLLQRSQNKEALAIQLKLNELIACQRGASNRLINVEDLSEEEVRVLHDRYEKLAQRGLLSGNVTGSLRIDKAGKTVSKNEEKKHLLVPNVDSNNPPISER